MYLLHKKTPPPPSTFHLFRGRATKPPNSGRIGAASFHFPYEMARNARVVIPGCAHHVSQRGNHRQDVFLCDADRRMYLRLLKHYALRFGMRVLGYCLMTNHVHLVVVPEAPDALAKGLGRTHNDYARWLHIRQGQSGHLWQNRFFSCPLEAGHLAEALRYVEVNPVRARIVAAAWDWEWSSARARVAGTDALGLIDPSDFRADCRGDFWRQVLADGWTAAHFAERLRRATQTGRPIGGEAFLARAEEQAGRSLRPQKRGPKARAQAA